MDQYASVASTFFTRKSCKLKKRNPDEKHSDRLTAIEAGKLTIRIVPAKAIGEDPRFRPTLVLVDPDP